ncbi:putative cbd9-like protein [Eutypa lata UCREL1]|uniref:Putative cbd9-like protein n=1 Tax=Eutypa lata (strain UCR-EL1) TaxID=1287681 RepID=M7T9S2_EUTLA|nr:putative cbd9-like protein [Eutypa lata UCREL1]
MHWKSASAYAIALLGLAPTSYAANSVVFRDAQSGFTFSSYDAQYVIGSTIAYRIAIPSDATASAPYDAVIQVVAPVAVGWAGLAWGGSMVRNPLAVGWASGSTPVVSSRWATGHTTPAAYPSAVYTLLSKATEVNGTHWKYTALCTGCTSFAGSTGTNILNPDGENRFAFAYSSSKPSGTSPDTTINVHSVTNYWTHDFAAAKNDNFDALVQQNA